MKVKHAIGLNNVFLAQTQYSRKTFIYWYPSFSSIFQVCDIVWCPHFKELVSGHGFLQNQLSIWKYPSMSKVAELNAHTSRILGLCASPDNTMVASIAADETLMLWNCFQQSADAKKNDDKKKLDPIKSLSMFAKSLR